MSLVFATLVAIFAFTKKLRLSRWEGGVLLGLYVVYIGWRYTGHL
jgi:Ca2+/Na+ antiporter